jgi:hypothetical protein
MVKTKNFIVTACLAAACDCVMLDDESDDFTLASQSYDWMHRAIHIIECVNVAAAEAARYLSRAVGESEQLYASPTIMGVLDKLLANSGAVLSRADEFDAAYERSKAGPISRDDLCAMDMFEPIDQFLCGAVDDLLFIVRMLRGLANT